VLRYKIANERLFVEAATALGIRSTRGTPEVHATIIRECSFGGLSRPQFDKPLSRAPMDFGDADLRNSD